MPIGDYNPVFDDPTKPRADGADGNGQKPEEEPAGEPTGDSQGSGNGKRPRGGKRDDKHAHAPVEMDKATKAFWRTGLQNAARKLAVDRARVLESETAWPRLVAQARALGVAEHVIVEAAAGANVEVPE